MTKLLRTFLNHVIDIVSTCTYRQPGKGDDGTCDCIGAIIGGLERSGLKWEGIHGTNYAVRQQSVEFQNIKSVNQLSVGDAVFKGRPQGSSDWDLPTRYMPGGQYYNGDMTDYYHVGVVTSVNPLNITHMTSPRGKTDTSLGKWGYFAKIKPLVFAGAYDDEPDPGPEPEPEQAHVYSENGKPVNMRKTASKSGTLIDKIPVGDVVDVLNKGEDWSKIKWHGKEGYMMTSFLVFEGDEPDIDPKPTPSVGSTATVYAPTGKYVKMRQSPSTSCRVYDDIPIGAVVTIVEPGETWAKVNHGWRKGWYIMAKFLNVNE